jgi:hypothetical protein
VALDSHCRDSTITRRNGAENIHQTTRLIREEEA